MIAAGRSKAVSLIACILLTGCAQHTWAPGPTAQGTFEQAKAQCSLMARHSGGSYYAQGTPAFVGGAMAGAAIGEAIRTQEDFNDCMSAGGWIATDVHSKANDAQIAARDHLQSIMSEAKLCAATAQANPKYAAIASHMRPVDAAHFTMTQMSDTTVPTPEQAALFASYSDEAAQCRDKTVEALRSIGPRASQALIQSNQIVTAVNLKLAQRQITWGQYARAGEDVNTQLAAGRAPTMPIIESSPITASANTPIPQNASLTAVPGAHVCTHDEQVQARLSRLNGYTGGPNCL